MTANLKVYLDARNGNRVLATSKVDIAHKLGISILTARRYFYSEVNQPTYD